MHGITETNGKHEFAFAGSREAIWHGLGQQIDEADLNDFEHWKVQAGLDWQALCSPVQFELPNGTLTNFPNRCSLFRSDTHAPLGIVSDDFKIVQPGEIIDFFRSLAENNGFRLSSAGTLFGGSKFWALADVGISSEITDGDRIDAHLLLVTALDGTMATNARFTSTRVVCNNTMRIAMRDQTRKPIVRVTHRKEFDPDAVKVDLGLLETGWGENIEAMRQLANTAMSQSETRSFFEGVFFNPKLAAGEQKWGATRAVDRMVDLAFNGSGSDMSKGTRWGALCAATEFFTHGTGKRDASHQFWSSYIADGDKKKAEIFDKLTELA